MTKGYGVAPSELQSHADNVRDDVLSTVAKAHDAARYEPGPTDMGILGFVISQVIDFLNDTDLQIMLTKEFGEDLTDRVEQAGRTYQDIEDEHQAILDDIDMMIREQQREQDMQGPRTL